MHHRTRNLLTRLISEAQVRQIVANPDSHRIAKCLETGVAIPDHLLPGRIIMRQSIEDRQKLETLKSDDIKSDRYKYW